MFSRDSIVFFCVGLAGIGFLAGVVSAVVVSLRGKPKDLHPFFRHAITSIGGVLATNLGAVLGINVEKTRAAGMNVASGKWSQRDFRALN